MSRRLLPVCFAGLIIFAIAWMFWRSRQTAPGFVDSPSPPVTAGSRVAPRPPGSPPRLSAAAALQFVSTHFNLTCRVISEPSGHLTLPSLDEPLPKLLTKYAEALNIPLVGRVDNGREELTLTAGAVIVGPTSPALEQLLDRLGRAGVEERPSLVNQLELLGDDRLEAVFVQRLLGDEESLVRAEAAAALQNARQPESHQALVRALVDADPWVVDNARVAIQQVGAIFMEPYLRPNLTASAQEARQEAADLLERIFGLALPENFWLAEADRQGRPE